MAANAGGGRRPGAGAHGTLVHLTSKNRILEAIIEKKLALGPSQEGAEPLDVHIGEFDSVKYHIVVPESELHLLHVGISAPFFSSIPKDDVVTALGEVFSEFASTLETGSIADGALVDSNAVLTLDCTKASGIEVARKLSGIRDAILGAPVRRALIACRDDAKTAAVELRYRAPDEGLWVIPRPGHRATVIWALDFFDPMDRVVARTICFELVDNQRRVAGSPVVHFTDASAAEPPKELRGRPVPKGSGHVGFLALTLEKRHVDSDNKLDNAVSAISMFRSYLTYHIAAAKAQLHVRMRRRVGELLKVLNRAKPEDPLASKEKKTMSGKTFRRK